MKFTTISAIAAIAFLIVGCSQKPAETTTEAPATAPAGSTVSLPAGLMLDAAPEGKVATINYLKASAIAGNDVLVKVVVGGRSKPMVENLAVMTVVDASLPNACTSGDDHCKTPWDYCCAGSDELGAAMATVRIVDEAGKPLGFSLADSTLKPGDSLMVAGTIAEKNDAGVLVINATGIHKP